MAPYSIERVAGSCNGRAFCIAEVAQARICDLNQRATDDGTGLDCLSEQVGEKRNDNE